MTGITKFIGKKDVSHDAMRAENFDDLIKDRSKNETREIEQALLKPKPIPKYIGPKTGPSPFLKRSIRVTFPNPECITRLGKFLRVNTYIQNNTYDVDMIMELVKLMEEGRLHWNKREKSFYFKERVGRRIRL